MLNMQIFISSNIVSNIIIITIIIIIDVYMI